MQKIESFTDLICWKESHKLVLQIYHITASFPKPEKYGLVDQLRRSVVSVTSNIAEGFSRRGSGEKIHFYYLSKSSLTELQNQLIIARDIKYINEKQFSEIFAQSVVSHKLINAFISSAKKL